VELVNDFTVATPIDEAWTTLTDVERIAPCMPGAQLQEVEGDTYRGIVKVKVGPIVAQFKGQATFVERDVDHHRAVLKAEGRDTGGKGNASALITAQLEPLTDASTKVTVTTDLTITGKVAQFGRGALADVSTKLLNQFVTQLHDTVLTADAPAAAANEAKSNGDTTAPAPTATGAAATAAATPAATSGPRTIDHPESEPVNLLATAGAPVAKRVVPIVIGVVVLVLLLGRRRRRRGARQSSE
jgi:carbon monoxide dehydrogenase subunit G